MTLTINGEAEQWPDGITVADLVSQRLRTDKGVAAAVDGTVVTRSTWAAVTLHDGQAVELVTAVQGG